MAIIPDWTLLVQMANFILLIFILNAVLYKPIRKILLERKKKIAGMEQAVASAQEGAAESQQAFKVKMSEAKMKGHQEKEALKEAARAEERKLVAEISEMAAKDLEAVRAQIAKQAQEAKKKLQGEIETFSASIAEKILGRAV
jgi:F-type H+-transporting ATPase subunit b